MEQKTKEQKDKRRYNLHYKLRKRGFTLITEERTFKVACNDKKYKQDKTSKKWLDELINDHQYCIQLIIE